MKDTLRVLCATLLRLKSILNEPTRTDEPTNQQSFKVVLGVGRIGIRKNWGEFATKGPTRITPEEGDATLDTRQLRVCLSDQGSAAWSLAAECLVGRDSLPYKK